MALISKRSLVNGYKIKKIGNLYKIIGPNMKYVHGASFTSRLKALNKIKELSTSTEDDDNNSIDPSSIPPEFPLASESLDEALDGSLDEVIDLEIPKVNLKEKLEATLERVEYDPVKESRKRRRAAARKKI